MKNTTRSQPFVSICTPTFNRRPFFPMIIKCFQNQTYPKDKMEWIILDDGTDKIEDIIISLNLPQIKYIRYEQKMTLGQKRNILNDTAKGSIIVYMDDDDYYPAERVSHAVERLTNSTALCAGSSAMLIYFKHINKMYQFGPYGPNHSTAATFAFKRELLTQTRFDENSSVAEEKKFLKDYTIPFVQLDSTKSILVFSHIHNSFDKKELLNQLPNPTITESTIEPRSIVIEQDILDFFMKDVDTILDNYEPGHIQNKPDVTKQLIELKETRAAKIREMQQNQQIQQNYQTIQQLSYENSILKDKVQYLEKKISQIISEQINKRKNETHIVL